MQQSTAALHMSKELKSQSLALACAFDQSGYVSNCVAHFAGLNHTEVWVQGGEWIIRNLWTSCAHSRNKRGLSCRWEPNQGYIRNGL